MDKKVIQMMFTNICSTDELRPLMRGVHFEKERCYASDGHILLIYKEGSEKLDGKTMGADGEEICGRYPNVDSVFPSKENRGAKFVTDFVQLKNACTYHMRKMSANPNDVVVIEGVGYNIRQLARLLGTIMLIGDSHKIQFFHNGAERAVTVLSDKVQSLIMPTLYRPEDIDRPKEDIADVEYLSFENLINNYVFNSWKKPAPKEALAWVG